MKTLFASLTHRERLGLACFVALLLLLGAGSALYRAATPPLEPLPLVTKPVPSASPAPTPPRASPAPGVVVYVTGAVRAPGIYRFPGGSRLFQAIGKAGGFRREAQREALNLADFLKDTDHIHVPVQGKPAPLAVAPVLSPTPPHPAGKNKLRSAREGQVHLNTASLEELQRLPGIGPSMAQRILDYRTENGGFQELAQLREVRGIGEKTFARLAPFLVL